MPGYFFNASFTPRARSVEIELTGNGDHNDIAVALQEVGDALAAFLSGAKIVRADEHDPLGIFFSARRSPADYRDAAGMAAAYGRLKHSGLATDTIIGGAGETAFWNASTSSFGEYEAGHRFRL